MGNKKFIQRALTLGLQIAFLTSLSGCLIFGDADNIQATVSGEPKVSFDALRAKDPQAKLGAKEHPKILAANGGEYKSAKLEQMLVPIAGALVTFTDDPDRAYNITVLNSPSVNAFALPGGYLYVTRGLLALANDQSEIAAVLAHEIAHVSSNHGIERSRQAKAAGIAERVVNDVVTSDIAGKVAKANTARRMSSFSQAQELQADAIGIKLIGKSGYDPFASARFLESMKRFADWRSALNSNEDDMSSSHPSTGPSQFHDLDAASAAELHIGPFAFRGLACRSGPQRLPRRNARRNRIDLEDRQPAGVHVAPRWSFRSHNR